MAPIFSWKDKGLEHMSLKKSKQLKQEHQIVLQALEVTNLAYQRVANVDEVIHALLPEQTELLGNTYANPLGKQVVKIMNQLLVRGFVFSPGKTIQRRYYGSVNVLDPQASSLPATPSRRSRVLNLVRDIVAIRERAVRSVEIAEFASERKEFEDLSPELIVRSVLSLAQTGELITKEVRGDGKGINLYLPAELDLKLYLPHEPVTWLEEIAHSVLDFWQERDSKAKQQGGKPHPFSTREFRSYVAKKDFRFDPHPTSDPQLLVNALISLSETRNPVLRKIRRPGEKASLWAPTGLTDEELDFGLAYANDAERVGEAVRRATERLGRPVNLHDISEETELDKSLKPTGRLKLFSILSDIAKEKIDAGDGTRQERVKRRIFKLGKVDGEAYYDVTNKLESRNYVIFQSIKSRWMSVDGEERVSALKDVLAPTILMGRARLIAAEVKIVADGLIALLKSKRLSRAVRLEAEELLAVVQRVLSNIDSWLSIKLEDGLKLPKGLNLTSAGWTADKLLAFLKTVTSRFERVTDHKVLISLMKENIRRIPNPNFVRRCADNIQAASEYLYDQTDALLYAAKKWGGYECCSQAMIADHELERLRDVRFVFPSLNAKAFNVRFASVACLAFLRSDKGNNLLLHMARHDSDAGIRRSALWAYCFARGKDAQELLLDRAMNDTHVNVSQFAKELMKVNGIDLWML